MTHQRGARAPASPLFRTRRPRNWRGLIVLAAAALVWAVAGSALGQPQQQMRVEMKGKRKLLDLRATEDKNGQWDATAQIFYVPCRGRFDFSAVGGSVNTSATHRYDAKVRLVRPSTKPRGLKCGRKLPRHVGSRRTRITLAGSQNSNRDRRFEALGHQRRDQVFEGSFQILGIPCPGTYRFEAHFRGAKGRRTYIYKVKISRAWIDGHPINPCS